MTRTEHLEWAKKRAYEYLYRGNVRDAYSSFLSDLGKHDELASAHELHANAIVRLIRATPEELRRWIEGFN